MKKSKSSQRWLQAHRADFYVKKAQADGYRSRAVYKLKEVDEKYRLIKPGMSVLELGAAPGGWTQYVTEKLQGRGRVVAVDCLAMDVLPDVVIIQGDFTEESVQDELSLVLAGTRVDVLLSDMAPNLSGIPSVDEVKSLVLAETSLLSASLFLKAGGVLFMKIFHGPGFDSVVKAVRGCFDEVSVRKPAASRPQSKETYLLARGYRL